MKIQITKWGDWFIRALLLYCDEQTNQENVR